MSLKLALWSNWVKSLMVTSFCCMSENYHVTKLTYGYSNFSYIILLTQPWQRTSGNTFVQIAYKQSSRNPLAKQQTRPISGAVHTFVGTGIVILAIKTTSPPTGPSTFSNSNKQTSREKPWLADALLNACTTSLLNCLIASYHFACFYEYQNLML